MHRGLMVASGVIPQRLHLVPGAMNFGSLSGY